MIGHKGGNKKGRNIPPFFVARLMTDFGPHPPSLRIPAASGVAMQAASVQDVRAQ
ncbi:hypothetical protein HNQ50_003291 [Silvimonas terrae]|uniref:Uncharacterized protein n=1 Tax=Silvimonas terrae TaxID=300266 RepID=A0A840RHI9_9NEIS|nr:hypothetical protein [Silvimonas terrae]